MMLPSITQELIHRSRYAIPQQTERGKWKHLYPVIEEMKAKGHTTRSAVEWLIDQQQVTPRDCSKLQIAFEAHKRRKEQRS